MGFWSKGEGWDIHDIYDWSPMVESGEEAAAKTRLRTVAKQAPAPVGLDQFRSYLDEMRQQAWAEPGEGYLKSPLYRGLVEGVGGVKERASALGMAEGARASAAGNYTHYGQGGLKAPTYGAALRQGVEQQKAISQMYAGAQGQAWQAQVQAQQQQFERVLALAGFDAKIQDADWEQKFRVWAKQYDIAQDEIEMMVERHKMIYGLLGWGVTAYAAYKGPQGGGGAASNTAPASGS